MGPRRAPGCWAPRALRNGFNPYTAKSVSADGTEVPFEEARGRAGLTVKCRTGVVSAAPAAARARMREAAASGGGAPASTEKRGPMTTLAGCSLRTQAAAEVAGLRADVGPHAGSGDRRQRRDLQRREGHPGRPASLPRTRFPRPAVRRVRDDSALPDGAGRFSRLPRRASRPSKAWPPTCGTICRSRRTAGPSSCAACRQPPGSSPCVGISTSPRPGFRPR